MQILDGKLVKQVILDEIKNKLKMLDRKLGLVVIQVGEDPASSVYVRQKENLAKFLECNFKHINLDENISEEELINVIETLNKDEYVDGILLQLPLPKHLDGPKIINYIDPLKDVDGLTNYNIDKLNNNEEGLIPCTPLGVIKLLEYYNIDIVNKNVVVVGRSAIVGKPVAKLLEKEGGNVTVCHSKTPNTSEITRDADILVVAVGKKDLITADMVKEGAVVVDVGINRVDNKLYGDVDFANVSTKCKFITPVPGGVGPMTIAMLANNLLTAYNLKKKRKKTKCLTKNKF